MPSMRKPELEKDYEARLRRERLDERYRLLRDWYGVSAAAEEMTSHCPPAQPIGEAMEKAMEGLLTKDLFNRFRIEEKWAEVAGEQIASMTCVSSYNRGVLAVEVAHPLYLKEVEMCEDLIRERIFSLFGVECEKIRFIPSTGRRR